MFHWHPLNSPDVLISWGELLPNRTIFYGALGLGGCLLAAWPRANASFAWWIGKRTDIAPALLADGARFAFASGAFVLSVAALVNSSFNPFIYFRF